jgi:predicted nucleic acid-binding protein
MVPVDTSVWIHFLANRSPYASAPEKLLAGDEVAGHELIYGELLIGDRGGRGKFLAAYETDASSKYSSSPRGGRVRSQQAAARSGRGLD